MQYDEAKLNQVLLMERMNQAQELPLVYWQTFYFQSCNCWYPHIWHHYNLALLLEQYSMATLQHLNKFAVYLLLIYQCAYCSGPCFRNLLFLRKKQQQEKHSHCLTEYKTIAYYYVI